MKFYLKNFGLYLRPLVRPSSRYKWWGKLFLNARSLHMGRKSFLGYRHGCPFVMNMAWCHCRRRHRFEVYSVVVCEARPLCEGRLPWIDKSAGCTRREWTIRCRSLALSYVRGTSVRGKLMCSGSLTFFNWIIDACIDEVGTLLRFVVRQSRQWKHTLWTPFSLAKVCYLCCCSDEIGLIMCLLLWVVVWNRNGRRSDFMLNVVAGDDMVLYGTTLLITIGAHRWGQLNGVFRFFFLKSAPSREQERTRTE